MNTLSLHSGRKAALSSGRFALRCLALAVRCWLVSACLLATTAAAFAEAAGRPAVATFPLEVTDALGRKLLFQKAPERIVSLTPSNTETLFAVGGGERVVGVTRFCNYPDEAQALPKIGGFVARTISVEAIVALHPSLVVAGDENQRPIIEALEQLGIPVISVKVRDFGDLYTTILLQGRLVDREAAAIELVAKMRARVEAVTRRVASIPAEKRLRVFWEVFDEPLMGAGPRSIVGQEIALAGGINIFDDVQEDYPHVSTEAVIMRDPQIILGPKLMRASSLTAEHLAKRSGWSTITAVRLGRVVALPDEPVSRPGPRLVDGLELLAAQIYPEYFPAVAK